MGFKIGSKSEAMLQGVHPDLVKVVRRAIELTPVDFMVFEGVRTLARQKEYVAKGVSKTLNSRHLTGHAVDLVPWIDGGLRWEDVPCAKIAKAVKQAAGELGVAVDWGLDLWGWDGPHFQLNWNKYPAL